MPTLRPTLYPLPLIGWRERVVLPKLGLGPLIAKIDTGARSAALHAEDISIRGSPRALCHSAAMAGSITMNCRSRASGG